MKKKLITILAVMLLLVLGMPSGAYAAPDEGASDEGYKFTLTVYGGGQGTFKGVKTWTKNDCELGDVVTISIDDVEVTNDRYYPRGFRISGHDNDETVVDGKGTTGSPQITYNATTDVSYEVAYGIKGKMVAYRVNYVDESGSTVASSDTYYGMPGDKPVISFKYVDGYLPDVYNRAMTLSEDESENIFTFTYNKTGAVNQNITNDNANADGVAVGAAGAAAAAGNGAIAPGTAGNPAGTSTAGGTTTIGDSDTPLAGPDQYQDMDEEGLGALLWVLIAIGAIALAAVLLIIRWLMKRRREDTESA